MHDGFVLQHHVRVIVKLKCCYTYKREKSPIDGFPHSSRMYPQLVGHHE